MMKIKIEDLLEEIADETLFASYQDAEHPKFIQIIEMGEEAIPQLTDYLIRSYNKDLPGVWHAVYALEIITDYDPVKEKNSGHLQSVIEDWVGWIYQSG